jgi:hypothetical protein
MKNPEARPSPLQGLKNFLLRILRRKPQPPADPDAERLVPVRRGPKGRSGAAVAEPEEDSYGFFPPRNY